MRELHEETGLTALPHNLNKIGLFEYEFTNPSLVPFIMEVRFQLPGLSNINNNYNL